MPNIVPALEDHSSYIYCPTCAASGNSQVELVRDTFQFRCMFSHTWTYAAIQQMIKNGQIVEMVKTRVIEQPSPHAQAYKVYVVPATWEKINQKFEGRLLTTLGTVFDALADDSIIFIDGPEVKELRLQGLKTGKDILAMVRNAKEQERTIETLQKQLDLLAPILHAAGLRPDIPVPSD
jgi:hypothetical protein